MRDQKLHAGVAGSTCRSENVHNTPFLEFFLEVYTDVEKVRSAVARSVFRSPNGKKHTVLGACLEVKLSKKCMQLGREAHFEVNIIKKHKTFEPLCALGGSKSAFFRGRMGFRAF